MIQNETRLRGKAQEASGDLLAISLNHVYTRKTQDVCLFLIKRDRFVQPHESIAFSYSSIRG